MAIEKRPRVGSRRRDSDRARRFIDGAASTFTGRQGRRSTNCTAGAAASSRLRQRPRNPEVLPKKKASSIAVYMGNRSLRALPHTVAIGRVFRASGKGQGLRSLVMGQEIGGSGGERETVSSCWIGDLRPTCKRASQIRVHVLYKRPEIRANTGVPAFAISVSYRKQEKAANPGSIPVSATNSV